MPSPYAKQMGASIVALLQLFEGKVPDAKSFNRTIKLALTEDEWLKANEIRREVREKLLSAMDSNHELKCAQYYLEESCLESLYNETDSVDLFDSVSPYWVVPHAIELAELSNIPIQAISDAMRPATS